VATACAGVIAVDLLAGNRQHMWIMNVVWPLTALWSGPLGLYYYFTLGTLSSRKAVMQAEREGKEPPGRQKPFTQVVGIAASHCGAGCTLGDLLAEGFVIYFPITLFGRRIFGTWALDFVLAFLLGIVFQYFTIQPMRKLSVTDGLIQALKADTLSITSWQIGMYGWMAVATFLIFGHEIEKTNPVFWLMMQIAMFAGFATSYPVNWWLVRKGVKEKM
jgi:hypothetical protein